MLYLTQSHSNLEYKPLFSAFVLWYERKVIIVNNGIPAFKLCIIDIDEADACVLTLKGVKLFKVIKVTRYEKSSLLDGEAIMSDIDALLEWRYNFRQT